MLTEICIPSQIIHMSVALAISLQVSVLVAVTGCRERIWSCLYARVFPI